MIVYTEFKYGGKTYNFTLDTERLDRNYNDEPYAYWVVVEKNIRFFEVNILKTAEVDGDFTNKGYVKCYDSIDKFDNDEPTETIDVTFIF